MVVLFVFEVSYQIIKRRETPYR